MQKAQAIINPGDIISIRRDYEPGDLPPHRIYIVLDMDALEGQRVKDIPMIRLYCIYEAGGDLSGCRYDQYSLRSVYESWNKWTASGEFRPRYWEKVG